MKACKYDPIAVARMFSYLREAQSLGQNRGARVDGLITWALGDLGQSWCDYYAVGFVLDICFQGESPFPRSQEINGNADAALDHARAQGWIVDEADAVPGDLVFSVDPVTGKAHHVALLVTLAPFVTIGGNTSEDGKSSNGDRVAEHDVNPANKVFVHYPRTPDAT